MVSTIKIALEKSDLAPEVKEIADKELDYLMYCRNSLKFILDRLPYQDIPLFINSRTMETVTLKEHIQTIIQKRPGLDAN